MGLGPQRKDSKTFGTLTHPSAQWAGVALQHRRAGNHFGTIRNPGLIWTPKQISGQVLLLRQDGVNT